MTDPKPFEGKFSEFVHELTRFDRRSGIDFLAVQQRLQLDRASTAEDRPWDLTPESLHSLSRFFLRWATDGGPERLTESSARELLRRLHPLQDSVNQRLVRSLDPDDQLELALRQEFLRAYWGTRGEYHLRPLDIILEALGPALAPLRQDFAELSRLPWMIAAVCRGNQVGFTQDELDPVCDRPRFAWLQEHFSLDLPRYVRSFDAGFAVEYFETAFHPLTVRPFLSRDRELIPAGLPFFFHSLREWMLSTVEEILGPAFGRQLNRAVRTSALRMVRDHLPGAQIIRSDSAGDADPICQNRIFFQDSAGRPILIQIVPQRLSDFHLPTCNVRNIYDRIAALITPTIHGLGEDLRDHRADFRRALPLVVTWTPLYMRHVDYLQRAVGRMLIEHYELEERFHPRYELLDLAELEVVFAHLGAFRDLGSLLETKRQQRYRQFSFTDFLRLHLGGRFQGQVPPLRHVEELRRQARTIVRNRQKRRG